jgi:hypothetical protein
MEATYNFSGKSAVVIGGTTGSVARPRWLSRKRVRTSTSEV